MFVFPQPEQWLEIAIDATLKGTLFLLLCGGASLAARRHAALRHFVHAVAIIGLLLLPLLTARLPHWQLSSSISTLDILMPPPVAKTQPLSKQKKVEPMAAVPTGIVPPVTTTDWSQQRALLLLLCWAAGTMVILGRLMWGQRAVRHLEKRSRVLPAESACTTLNTELAHQLNIKRCVTLRIASDETTSIPMTWGLWRPVILLPATAESWPLDKLRSVLLHELGHVRRYDWATQHVGSLTCALYWFNPLVWLTAAGLRAQSERATDNSVLTAGIKASDYCSHLLEMAQNSYRSGEQHYAASYAVPMARKAAISNRLKALLDKRQQRRGLNRPIALTVAALFCLALGSLAAFDTQAQGQPNTTPEDEPIAEVPLPIPPAPNPAQAAAAQDILRKSRAAYAALTSYQGSTRTTSVSFVNGQQMADLASTADIIWAKPNLLLITGKDSSAHPYSIIGNADGSWDKWPLSNNGKWRKSKDLIFPLSTMAGVARKAPTTIPMLLLNELPELAFANSGSAALEKEEEINGHPCFKLTAVGREETRSWWIDKSNFLLRRIFESYTEAQSQAMQARTEKVVREAAKKRPELAVGLRHIDMRFVSATEEFDIKAINEPIPPETFAAPKED